MSSTRNKIITLLVILGFVAFLAWSTIQSQGTECEVCVQFNGRENCATASGPSELEATQTAQNTACGPVTFGMDDAIACDNKPPISRSCRRR
jgi:hypothetical protein